MKINRRPYYVGSHGPLGPSSGERLFGTNHLNNSRWAADHFTFATRLNRERKSRRCVRAAAGATSSKLPRTKIPSASILISAGVRSSDVAGNFWVR